MADGEVVISEISCKCCEGFKVKLKKVLELNSAREIIRVLQEMVTKAECGNTSRQQAQEGGKREMNEENVDGWTRVIK
jgi:hypothetical protein